MLKKIVLIISVVFVAAGLTACGASGGKYSDIKSLLGKMTATMEKFGKDMDNAKDGKAVAKALTSFSTEFQDLSEKMNKLQDKYKDFELTTPPEELKADVEKFTKASTTITNSLAKIMQYATDPDVMKAMEKFQDIQ